MGRYKYNEKKLKDVTDDLKKSKTKYLEDVYTDIYDGLSIIVNARNSECINGLEGIANNLLVLPLACKDAVDNQLKDLENAVKEIKEYSESEWWKKLGSTIFMGGEKFLEGVFTAGENLVDGAASIVGLFCKDKTGISEFIATDWVGKASDALYDSKFGKAVNKYSYMDKDSTGANLLKAAGTMAAYIVIPGGEAAFALGGLGAGMQSGLQSGKSYGGAFLEGTKDAALMYAGGKVIGKGLEGAQKLAASVKGSEKFIAFSEKTVGKISEKVNTLSTKNPGSKLLEKADIKLQSKMGELKYAEKAAVERAAEKGALKTGVNADGTRIVSEVNKLEVSSVKAGEKVAVDIKAAESASKPTIQAVESTAKSVAESASKPTIQAVESTAKTVVESTAKPTIQAVESTVKPTIQAVESTVKPTIQAVESTVKPTIQAVESTAKPTIQAVEPKSFASSVKPTTSSAKPMNPDLPSVPNKPAILRAAEKKSEIAQKLSDKVNMASVKNPESNLLRNISDKLQTKTGQLQDSVKAIEKATTYEQKEIAATVARENEMKALNTYDESVINRQRLQQELAARRETETQLKTEIGSFRNATEISKNSTDALKADLREAESFTGRQVEKQQVASELKDSSKEALDSARKVQRETKKGVKNLEEELQKLDNQERALQKERGRIINEMKENGKNYVPSATEEANIRINEISNELDGIKSARNELKSQLNEAKNALEQGKAEVTSLNAEYKENAAISDIADQRVASAKTTEEALKGDIGKIEEAKVRASSTDARELDNLLKNNSQEIKRIESELAEAKDAEALAKSELDKASVEAKTTRAQADEAKMYSDYYKDKTPGLSERITNASDRLSSKAEGISEKFSNAKASAKEHINNAAASAKEHISNAATSTKEYISSRPNKAGTIAPGILTFKESQEQSAIANSQSHNPSINDMINNPDYKSSVQMPVADISEQNSNINGDISSSAASTGNGGANSYSQAQNTTGSNTSTQSIGTSTQSSNTSSNTINPTNTTSNTQSNSVTPNATPVDPTPNTNPTVDPVIKPESNPNINNNPVIPNPIPENIVTPTPDNTTVISNGGNHHGGGGYTPGGNSQSGWNSNSWSSSNNTGTTETVTEPTTPTEIPSEINPSNKVPKSTITTTTIPTNLDKTNTKSAAGTKTIPVLAGLGAAAAIGVGAKVYMDNKKNNDNGEYDEFDEGMDDEILADEWNENDEETNDIMTNDMGFNEQDDEIITDETYDDMEDTSSDNDFGEM